VGYNEFNVTEYPFCQQLAVAISFNRNKKEQFVVSSVFSKSVVSVGNKLNIV